MNYLQSLAFIKFISTYPNFGKIITGKFFSIMTGRMIFTIMGWEIYKITSDPLAIGLLGLCEVVPAIIFSLLAGNIIDLYSRKKIILIVAFCNLMLVTVLTILTFSLDADRWVFIFYGFAFMVGVFRSFWGSTLSTMVPNIIPQNKIPQAGPYNTGAFLFGSIIGHALGGFLISIMPVPNAISLGIAFFIICLVSVATLPKQPIANRKKANTFQNIKEGIVYVYQTKIIFSALMLDLTAVLFGGVVALLPIFAKDILFISPRLFGFLNAAMDIGAGLGIINLSLFPMKRHQGKKMIWSVCGFGLCIILFALSRNVVLSFLLLAFAGFFDSISMVVRGIILQSYVPDYIRGRVMSVNSIFVASSNELGQFESGFTSRIMGVVPAALFGGVMTLIAASSAFIFSPKLRNLKWN